MSSDYIMSVINDRIHSVKNRETEMLDLRKLRLTSIPEPVFLCKEAKFLDVSSDAVIDRMRENLSEEYWWEVSFDNNEISVIPPEIAQLSSLEGFFADQNQIYRIPQEIGKLKNLRTLTLRNNFIAELPEELFDLESLEILDLSYNEIEIIPEAIGKLKNLKELYLGCNRISKLPAALGNLKKLEYLELRNYDQSKIHPDVIEKFSLHQNQIRSFPPEMGNLENLEQIDLENLPLENVYFEMLDIQMEAFLWYIQNEEQNE